MKKRVEYTPEEIAEFEASHKGEAPVIQAKVEEPVKVEEAVVIPPVEEVKPPEVKSEPVEEKKEEPQVEKKPEVKPRDVVSVRTGSEIKPLIPTSLDEIYRFARMMAATYNLHESYYKLPKKELVSADLVNVLDIATTRAVHAIQLGLEVGLPPAQAIQSIFVLNGVGTIWGDAQLALCLKSGLLTHFKEYTVGEMWTKYDLVKKDNCIPNRDYKWVCEVKRAGDEEITVKEFSIHDAIHAGLWSKGVWATHPGRMGTYKIRAFSLRDKFADVLKGLSHSYEEFEGEMIDITPNGGKITPHNSGAELSSLLENKPAEAMPVVNVEQKEKVAV